MSFQAMAWASEQTTGSATRKAVLYSLANHANKEGECYLKVSTICAEAELADRATRTALADLAKAKLITKNRKRREDGTLGILHFTLQLPAPAALDAVGPAAADAAHEPVLRTRPEPIGQPLPQASPTKEESMEPRCHRCGGRLPLEGEPYDKRVTDYCCAECATKVVAASKAERDAVWDALQAQFGDPTTPRGRARMGATLRELLADSALSPAEVVTEIPLRAQRYRAKWPDADLTLEALAKHWPDLRDGAANGRRLSAMELVRRTA